MSQTAFDFSEDFPPRDNWIRFNENFELETYQNGKWISIEEYERIRSEKENEYLSKVRKSDFKSHDMQKVWMSDGDEG